MRARGDSKGYNGIVRGLAEAAQAGGRAAALAAAANRGAEDEDEDDDDDDDAPSVVVLFAQPGEGQQPPPASPAAEAPLLPARFRVRGWKAGAALASAASDALSKPEKRPFALSPSAFETACGLVERRTPVALLLAGTSGSGKSTLAGLLSARLGGATVVSTDSVRHVLASSLPADSKEAQLLRASTHEAGDLLVEWERREEEERSRRRRARRATGTGKDRGVEDGGAEGSPPPPPCPPSSLISSSNPSSSSFDRTAVIRGYEAQAALGLARAHGAGDPELDGLLVDLERDLYVLMAEVATLPENRDKLSSGVTLVSEQMVENLEGHIDRLTETFAMPTEFVVPGQNLVAASLDVARTTVRRAERLAVAAGFEDSWVIPYLNRLSDLVWTMARWQEGEHFELAKARREGN